MYFKIHVYKYYFYNNQKTKLKPYWNLKNKTHETKYEGT